jgi:hypothetical protein
LQFHCAANEVALARTGTASRGLKPPAQFRGKSNSNAMIFHICPSDILSDPSDINVFLFSQVAVSRASRGFDRRRRPYVVLGISLAEQDDGVLGPVAF